MSDARLRNRSKTINDFRQAIKQLQDNQVKVSISSVAKIVGVTPALIHNTYPDVAEQIRGLTGKTTRKQRDAKHEELIKEKAINRALRAELVETREFVAKLASVNQVLLNEITLLKGQISGKVISVAQTSIEKLK
jgi:hypothetical protein